MSESIKESEEQLNAGVVEHEEEVKEFAFATVMLTCKCGHTQEMIRHVEHGVQFILATNDKNALVLHCEECGSDLRLHCVEGTPPPKEEVETETELVETEINEDIPEESKEGESL